ncbi:hypothetical protein [Raoultibacter phocaeensis]|uniref:hypothetical protein n=1 Tax=Raoultibacter phocaeensis TaxID=2479841 RepID=UPI001117D784|nr:hypothetical protein [Raoultibacter phocaeensis]
MRDSGKRMQRRTVSVIAIAAVLVVLVLLLPSCSGGWGAATQSVLDRLMPNPVITMWAQVPEPDAYTDSYSDATGAGTNYVYKIDAATERGDIRELTIISFGSKTTGEGYLEIDAKGSSGVHYRGVDESDVPEEAERALQEDAS